MRIYSIILALLTASLSSLASDYERFEENGKIGLKDNSGKIVLPASFDALGWSDGTFSVAGQITGYRKQNRWGLLNLKKEFITPADYETLIYSGGDRVVVTKFINHFTIKSGSIDFQGKVVIPFSYDDITLHGLRAMVMVKNGTRYEYGLIDLNDRSILPIRYKQITPIGSLRYAVEDFSGKFALCSEEGKWITDFIIDGISPFQFDLAVIHKEWKQGVIDRNGEVKVQPLYREIKITAPGQVQARKADVWKILDADLHEVEEIEADEIAFTGSGLGISSVNGKYGLVDDDLKVYWQPDFDYLGSIENHQIVAKKNGKFGLLRMDQSAVLPITFDSLCAQGNFIRTLQTLAGTSSWDLYDTFGIRKTKTSYEFIGSFNGKFFPARNHGYQGVLDRYGVERIACVYDSIIAIKDDLVVVGFQGQYGIVTIEDQWQLLPQKNPFELLGDNRFGERKDSLFLMKDFTGNVFYFTDNPVEVFPDHLLERLPDGTLKEINFQGQIVSRKAPVVIQKERTEVESEGLMGIQRDGKFGFVDGRGRLRIANRYDDIGEFHDGIAPVKLLGKWGFINASDQIVIQPTYESVESFKKGVSIVSRKKKFGLMDSTGIELLALRYDSISRLTDQFFLLTLDSLLGLADRYGNVLIEPRFEHLRYLENGSVIVGRNDKYGLLTTQGMSTVPMVFDHLMFDAVKKYYLTAKKSPWIELNIGGSSNE